MADVLLCSCHVIGTEHIRNYLRTHGPVLTEKDAKKARAALHQQARESREADGLTPNPVSGVCGSCANRLLEYILKESRDMYPEHHKEAA